MAAGAAIDIDLGPVRRCITVEQRLCGGACHTPRSLTMQEKALSSSDGKADLSGGCDQGNVSPPYAPAWGTAQN
jgi:hypothetical protein